MNDSAPSSHRAADKVEIAIHLDPELLDQLKHLTNDPSKIVETALRQWLRGETQRDDDLTRTLVKSPPVPPRGEWND
ncbi:type II toxin-antitoxin system CcdA family antitoxin [Desertifilum sp. FACHB-1129]|uniref:Type II toxin-antitoxin system CcdA family antitoxin n=1 Tax=Desertifilum tharense IPPAS B-1220 TaxID=1781255 RepID=A0A1E5QQ13_9CYAN|nr:MULTISPECIES: type II toxin-antitoxin system CcdA family antitoxin [Desertifilum]MCD8486219.1 type II toxin-antitoxin system CcdA family antitoxin [Desertifilum sp.]MDA0212582.1 type II toxin-antitoxin system CcdA family antitoxin [Cyanobacteria bacterium FC1]MBD2314556.1 type II toxin-antitoxin system CcdA family antitoxin [Desertifilum sp. FACHB-1129]MBD2321768.1 type II toxin-antitoxin system CcdA family antitoxin [Desertifilum sp. FACHB-866]MBD2331895.1 type II toxin-antitoxin system Cc